MLRRAGIRAGPVPQGGAHRACGRRPCFTFTGPSAAAASSTIWDYVNYILKQYHAEAAFAQSTGAGFRFLLDSITEDYTNFITLFTEFPVLPERPAPATSYAFCQVFSVLPSLLVLLAGLTVKVGQMLRVKNRFWYFLIGFIVDALTYPWRAHVARVLGQPDWFGPHLLPSCLSAAHAGLPL
ncbi:MAG: hypothetical protein ACLVJH_17365 [Faecalibacterium prausnitzii]